MKAHAEENHCLKQQHIMLISSLNLINRTFITPFFNFYLVHGLQCTTVHGLVQYTPLGEFNSFLQSVVDARQVIDENPLSGGIAETLRKLGITSNGYQIMASSKHTMTKYLGDEKNHKAKKTSSSRGSIL